MSNIEKSEIEIIKGCKTFNREAQKSLYKLYYGKMNAISFRYTGSYDDAKDIVHDSFVIVFEKIAGYTGSGSLEGWIRKIVVNKSIDFLNKKNKLYVKVSEQEQQILNDHNSNSEYSNNKEGDELDSIYSSGLTKEEIMDAIDLLKDNYRVVFNLSVIDGYSHKNIAETLNITEELSRIRLKRARVALQAILLEAAKAKKINKITNQTHAKSIE